MSLSRGSIPLAIEYQILLEKPGNCVDQKTSDIAYTSNCACFSTEELPNQRRRNRSREQTFNSYPAIPRNPNPFCVRWPSGSNTHSDAPSLNLAVRLLNRVALAALQIRGFLLINCYDGAVCGLDLRDAAEAEPGSRQDAACALRGASEQSHPAKLTLSQGLKPD